MTRDRGANRHPPGKLNVKIRPILSLSVLLFFWFSVGRWFFVFKVFSGDLSSIWCQRVTSQNSAGDVSIFSGVSSDCIMAAILSIVLTSAFNDVIYDGVISDDVTKFCQQWWRQYSFVTMTILLTSRWINKCT